MRRPLVIGLAVIGLSACGYVDKYEEGVYDYEPTYCYAALGGTVECYREPVHADDLRLVNYYGPHPSRFDAPEKPEPIDYKAPPMVNAYVKDPEPMVRARPQGSAANHPWLAPGYQAPVPQSASPQATQALVRQAHESMAAEAAKRAEQARQAQAAQARDEQFQRQLETLEFPFQATPQSN